MCRRAVSGESAGDGEVAGDASAESESPLVPTQLMYVPVHPVARDGEIVIGYETREIAPGSPALPVFSSEEKLVENR
ncbi:hypothetical protein GCM10022254_22320 [Actinomadura meridiana]|uniref:Uncharacterized protein n=1 Tax=Actinomadura meridiana TaxID=559626 RepID=A0ABP8BXG3_9ACTN